MKNNGFTLIELLGVVIILAVIFILVFPSVTNILLQSKETVYQKQINDILTAAYNFSLKNINYLPEKNNKSYVTLGQLKYEGLVEVNIKNPETNEIFEDNLVISIHNVGANYKYSNNKSKLEGDYLYTIEEQITDKTLIPKISLDGLSQNSDGNYIMTLDLNEEFDKINFTATSYDDVDLTSEVKKYILINETAVENIDSSKSGIYKVNYSVVDDNGYANSIILNVIIADTISPTLSNLDSVTINKDVTNYDLLNNVTCEDNSGYCDITTSGKIDYGVIGKYIIEYTAQDPSGNTTTQKRVITIE